MSPPAPPASMSRVPATNTLLPPQSDIQISQRFLWNRRIWEWYFPIKGVLFNLYFINIFYCSDENIHPWTGQTGAVFNQVLWSQVPLSVCLYTKHISVHSNIFQLVWFTKYLKFPPNMRTESTLRSEPSQYWGFWYYLVSISHSQAARWPGDT